MVPGRIRWGVAQKVHVEFETQAAAHSREINRFRVRTRQRRSACQRMTLNASQGGGFDQDLSNFSLSFVDPVTELRDWKAVLPGQPPGPVHSHKRERPASGSRGAVGSWRATVLRRDRVTSAGETALPPR